MLWFYPCFCLVTHFWVFPVVCLKSKTQHEVQLLTISRLASYRALNCFLGITFDQRMCRLIGKDSENSGKIKLSYKGYIQHKKKINKGGGGMCLLTHEVMLKCRAQITGFNICNETIRWNKYRNITVGKSLINLSIIAFKEKAPQRLLGNTST